MDLVRAFDQRAEYPVKFEDVNSIYKEGLEIIVEDEEAVSKFLLSLPLDSTESEEEMNPNRFSIKGPFVIHAMKPSHNK